MKLIKLIILLLFPILLSAQFTETKFIHTTFPYTPESVTSGDIDGDGFIDMVFANGGSLNWSKNIGGSGKWSTNQAIDKESISALDVHLADLDNDNDLDIILTGEGSFTGHLDWYRNDGSGKFSEAIPIDTQNDPLSSVRDVSVSSGDIDNDGDIDLAVAYALAGVNKVGWYRNEDGIGGYSDFIETTTAITDPFQIQLVHANSDDFLDIIFMGEDQTIFMHENFNGIAFTAETPIANTNIEFLTYHMADIDGDNDLDILGNEKATGKLFLYENVNNDGFFAAQELISDMIGYPIWFNPIDIDGDNDLDIVYLNNTDDNLGYLKNDGTGVFENPVITYSAPANTTFSYSFAFDADNDNDIDFVAVGSNPFSHMMFTNSDGLGNFTFDQRLNMSPPAIRILQMGDLNGDGFADAIVESNDSEPLILSWMKYNPTHDLFEKPDSIPGGTTTYGIFIIDINNDGRNDIVYMGGNNEKELVWHLNLGNNEFSTANFSPSPSLTNHSCYPADMNNDGWIDIVASSKFSTGGIIWYENLGAAGGFATPITIYPGVKVRRLAIEDIDGDNLKDIAFVLQDDDEIGWIKNSGGGTFAPYQLIADIDDPIDIAIYDFNQDGFQDILLLKKIPYSDFGYIPGTDLGTFGSVNYFAGTNSNPEYFHIFDYDLDGFSDILYQDDGANYWHKNTGGNGTFATAEEFFFDEPGSYQFFLNDVDSDGDKDFVFHDYYYAYYQTNIAANGKITAKAFFDENNNGNYDNNESTLNGFQFNLDPDQTLFITANDSASQFFVSEGSYVLNANPLPGWDVTTGILNYPVDFVTDSVINKLFGFYPTVPTPSINVDLTSAPTRCGFTIPFWLTYTNDGWTTEDGQIELYVENFATYVSATPLPDTIINDTLYWNFESLPPTHQKTIDLQFEIFGVGFLGDSVSVKTNAYISQGNGNYDLSNDFDFISEINCAYDPNDKLVIPEGFLDENYTLFGEDLIYTVRFQNTGTDTAFNIKITDLLDSDLDWSSFQVITSSHLMETEIDPEIGLVEFYFPNILLPDSLVNQQLSHGFLKYKISPKSNLPEGTEIENSANIFFDFNPPIVTNITLNNLVSMYPISVNSTIEHPLCANDMNGKIELTVVGIEPFSYAWNSSSLSGVLNENLPAGNYEVTITDGTGGTMIESFVLIDPIQLLGELSATAQIDNSLGTATINPSGGTNPYSILWNTNPTQSSNTIIDLEAGFYTATISDDNDCIFQDSIEVEFFTPNKNLEKQLEIEIFPNPTDGKISLDFGKIMQEDVEINITNTAGKVFYKNQFSGTPRLLPLNFKNKGIPAGIYFIGINVENKWSFKKLIVLP